VAIQAEFQSEASVSPHLRGRAADHQQERLGTARARRGEPSQQQLEALVTLEGARIEHDRPVAGNLHGVAGRSGAGAATGETDVVEARVLDQEVPPRIGHARQRIAL
jgi:hypothetical protein